MPTPDSGPFGITAGLDDAMWFTEMNADRIGRITSRGEITEFSLPCVGAYPSAITAGPDEALWFTLNQANAIGRITVHGDIVIHPLPTPSDAPVGITSDGTALWFVEIAEYGLPSPSSEPHGITLGPDGALWAALETGGVARLEP